MKQTQNGIYGCALYQTVKGARIEKVASAAFGTKGDKAYNLTLSVATGKVREDGTARQFRRYGTIYGTPEQQGLLDTALTVGAYLTASGKVLSNDYKDQQTGQVRDSERIAFVTEEIAVTTSNTTLPEIRQKVIGGVVEKVFANAYGTKGEKAYNLTLSVETGKTREDGTPRLLKRRATIFAPAEKQAYLDTCLTEGAVIFGSGYVIPDDYKDKNTGETRDSEKIILPADILIIGNPATVSAQTQPVQQVPPAGMPFGNPIPAPAQAQPTQTVPPSGLPFGNQAASAQPVQQVPPTGLPFGNPVAMPAQAQPAQTVPPSGLPFGNQAASAQPVQQVPPTRLPFGNPAAMPAQAQPAQAVPPSGLPFGNQAASAQPVQQVPPTGLPFGNPIPAPAQAQPAQAPVQTPPEQTSVQPQSDPQEKTTVDAEYEKYMSAVADMQWFN